MSNQSREAGLYPIVLRLGQDTLPVFFSECLQKRTGHVGGFLEVSGLFEEFQQSNVGSSLEKRVASFRNGRYGLQVGLTRRLGSVSSRSIARSSARDRWTPFYAHRHRFNEVLRWFSELGLEARPVDPVTVQAVLPVPLAGIGIRGISKSAAPTGFSACCKTS